MKSFDRPPAPLESTPNDDGVAIEKNNLEINEGKTAEVLDFLSPEKRTQHTAIVNRMTQLLMDSGFDLNEKRASVLSLKLARYLQREDEINLNTLRDAIIETPRFLDREKGGFHRLLEIHIEKTLIRIAETRKRRAEITGNEAFNPYIAEFQSKSGALYLARLINMPHLEEESEYLEHCVGTSDHYISSIKDGSIEIFSIRNTGDHTPLYTIEYNKKEKRIDQIKGKNDDTLDKDDPNYLEILDLIGRVSGSIDDEGNRRVINYIEDLNLRAIPEDSFLTSEGLMTLEDVVGGNLEVLAGTYNANLEDNPDLLDKVASMRGIRLDTTKAPADWLCEIKTVSSSLRAWGPQAPLTNAPRAYYYCYDKLEEVKGDLDVSASWYNFTPENLRIVGGNLFCAYRQTFEQLEHVGGYITNNIGVVVDNEYIGRQHQSDTLNFPELKEVGYVYLVSGRVLFPKLKKVTGGEDNKFTLEANEIDLHSLEEIDGDLRICGPSRISLPSLKKIENGSIAFPSLNLRHLDLPNLEGDYSIGLKNPNVQINAPKANIKIYKAWW